MGFGNWACFKLNYLIKHAYLLDPFFVIYTCRYLCSKASVLPFSCRHLIKMDLIKLVFRWLCDFTIRPDKFLSAHCMAVNGCVQGLATAPKNKKKAFSDKALSPWTIISIFHGKAVPI